MPWSSMFSDLSSAQKGTSQACEHMDTSLLLPGHPPTQGCSMHSDPLPHGLDKEPLWKEWCRLHSCLGVTHCCLGVTHCSLHMHGHSFLGVTCSLHMHGHPLAYVLPRHGSVMPACAHTHTLDTHAQDTHTHFCEANKGKAQCKNHTRLESIRRQQQATLCL